MRHVGGRLGSLVTLVVVVAACGSTTAPSASVAPTSSPTAPASIAPTPSTIPSGPPADIGLELISDDLSTPVGLVTAPGDQDRAFILEQTGLIHILRDGAIEEEPFLDLSDHLARVDPEYDERGLLGLAFDPDFAANRRFFVYYSAPPRAKAAAGSDHTDTLSSFTVSATDPDVADPATERIVLQFEQPQPNHSGGAFGFGPDGFLYLGTGDGGGRGDADAGHSKGGNAQDTQKLNGKILRLDVRGSKPYEIPADNPFATGGGRPEIYAYGLRNPWRLTWEPAGARRLLVSDVGYGRYEEVDVVVNGGNYGWRIREGAHCLDIARPLDDVTGCATAGAKGEPLIDPVVEYTHKDVGIAVVGGYIYRGSVAALAGQYVFADFSADWTTAEPNPRASMLVALPSSDANASWPWRRLTIDSDAIDHLFITGMGEDAAGEVYVMARSSFGPQGRTGRVFRIVVPAA